MAINRHRKCRNKCKILRYINDRTRKNYKNEKKAKIGIKVRVICTLEK